MNEPGSHVITISSRDPLRVTGGAESAARAQALALRAAGFEPRIFHLAARAGAPRQTAIGELHPVATPVRPIRTMTAAAHIPLLARAIRRYLAGYPGPHLVHGFQSWSLPGIVAARSLARDGIRVVVLNTAFTTYEHEAAAKLRGLGVHHGHRQLAIQRVDALASRTLYRELERRATRPDAVHRVLVNYASTARLLERAYGPATPIERIAWASPQAFEPERPPSGPPEELARLEPREAPLVVAVSRHDARKGVDVLLRALATLVAQGTPLRACLVGPGALLEAHRRLAGELGLGECVAIPGQVPNSMDFLRWADVYVLPSLEEGCGALSVLEAMQAGRALVASDVDGVPEDVSHGRDGLLVAPGDPDALARAIAGLLADPRRRELLGAAARETFERRFSAAAYTRDLTRVYAEAGIEP